MKQKKAKGQTTHEVIQLLQSHPRGLSTSDISNKLGVPHGNIQAWISHLLKSVKSDTCTLPQNKWLERDESDYPFLIRLKKEFSKTNPVHETALALDTAPSTNSEKNTLEEWEWQKIADAVIGGFLMDPIAWVTPESVNRAMFVLPEKRRKRVESVRHVSVLRDILLKDLKNMVDKPIKTERVEVQVKVPMDPMEAINQLSDLEVEKLLLERRHAREKGTKAALELMLDEVAKHETTLRELKNLLLNPAPQEPPTQEPPTQEATEKKHKPRIAIYGLLNGQEEYIGYSEEVEIMKTSESTKKVTSIPESADFLILNIAHTSHGLQRSLEAQKKPHQKLILARGPGKVKETVKEIAVGASGTSSYYRSLHFGR